MKEKPVKNLTKLLKIVDLPYHDVSAKADEAFKMLADVLVSSRVYFKTVQEWLCEMFYDTHMENKKKYKNKRDIFDISNTAAKKFLYSLINGSRKQY